MFILPVGWITIIPYFRMFQLVHKQALVIQNAAAKILTRTRKSTSFLSYLHCIKISFLNITNDLYSMNDLEPQHLPEFLVFYYTYIYVHAGLLCSVYFLKPLQVSLLNQLLSLVPLFFFGFLVIASSVFPCHCCLNLGH